MDTASRRNPILSKWIIMMLAVSVSLNGYLLKGIAAALAGKGLAGKDSVRFAGTPSHDDAKLSKPSWRSDELEIGTVVRPKPVKPAIPVIAAPSAIAPTPRRIPKILSLDIK